MVHKKIEMPTTHRSMSSTVLSPERPTRSRIALLRGWPLLLICLIWAGVSLGCVSISYLTEIIRREDGSHGVDLVAEVALDQDVMQLLPESDPADQQDSIAEQAELGWACEYLDQGSRFVCGRSFASPEEFNQQAVGLLQTLFDAEGDNIIVSEISVDVATTAGGEPEYEVTYVALAPDPDSTGACQDEGSDSMDILFCDGFNELIAQSISEDIETLNLDPALEQAILEADPPTIVFGVRLPGTVVETYINGAPGGESIQPNEARFTLTEEDKGAFTFQVFGQAADLPPSQANTDNAATDEDQIDVEEADAETALAGLATSSLIDQSALDKVQEILDTKADAQSKAAAQSQQDLLNSYLTKDWWHTPTDDPTVQATLDVMADALYLATLRDSTGGLLFPSVHAGLSIHTILLKRYYDTGDQGAANALADLTGLLVLQDLK